jgi:hypothetical protein
MSKGTVLLELAALAHWRTITSYRRFIIAISARHQ